MTPNPTPEANAVQDAAQVLRLARLAFESTGLGWAYAESTLPS